MGTDPHVDVPRMVYDASASEYVAFVGTELGEATEDAIDRSMLAAFVDLLRSADAGTQVADLGCGPGRVAAYLAREQLDVVGIDVSSELLTHARAAHPHLHFEEGRIDDLPFVDDALSGAVCWYSIMYTPPDRVDGVLAEISRVVAATGLVLLAFQAGSGEGMVKADAHNTGMALTSYLHDVDDIARRLDGAGFDVHASTLRSPSLGHETGPQAFIIARKR